MSNLLDGVRRLRQTLGVRSPQGVADRLIAAGNRAEDDGRPREACEAYRQAVDAAPEYARAHLNLGIGLNAAGDVAGAERCFETALALDPADPYVNYNLAHLLHTRGNVTRAEQLLDAALERKPEFPEACVVLSNVYDAQGRLAEAAALLEVALKQRPGYAGAWYNLGDVLFKLERRTEAEHAFRRAIELDPTSLPAMHMLAHLLRSSARVEEALEVLAAARRLAPSRVDLESMELHALSLSDETTEETLVLRHRSFGERLEAAVPARFAPFRNSRDPERPLRVGYVSSDFNLHPVAWFVLPVLERHDRTAFRIYCYSTTSNRDDTTSQIEARADVWRKAFRMSDDDIADMIHGDEIDILVDLTGHAGIMRLGVFAQQPAPVQACWLGYLGTTGLTRMHYRLCDAHTDPPGSTDALHTETLVRLPHSQWCYRPVASVAQAAEPPCMRNDFITFGSFNHVPKLSPSVRRLWCEILGRMPDARLILVGVPEGPTTDRLLGDFRECGISGARLTVVPRVPLEEYFALFNTVDIALDTLPYSGGTTTCDTLWMGVPVLTAPATLSVSRSSASILSTVGLSAWIASSPEDYVRRAVEFARDRAAITELRSSLRARLQASPLMDERQFTRDLEGAYRQMWGAWCKAQTP